MSEQCSMISSPTRFGPSEGSALMVHTRVHSRYTQPIRRTGRAGGDPGRDAGTTFRRRAARTGRPQATGNDLGPFSVFFLILTRTMATCTSRDLGAIWVRGARFGYARFGCNCARNGLRPKCVTVGSLRLSTWVRVPAARHDHACSFACRHSRS